jgi:hypothetical protein
MVGFTFNGLSLENVRLFWIEGQDDIEDFLTDQSLPESLPPAMGGRLSLDFMDSDGRIRSAFYSVSVTFRGEVESPADSGGVLRLLPVIVDQRKEAQ